MAEQPIYVPILKGREGEFAALQELKSDVRSIVMPLIEVPPTPHDFANDRPAKSLDDHFAAIPERLAKSSAGQPIYLDVPFHSSDERLGSGQVAFDVLLGECRSNGVISTPVVKRMSTATHLSITGKYARLDDVGVCLRLTPKDFDEEIELDTEVDRILAAIRPTMSTPIDLLLDLQDIGTDTSRSVLVSRYVLSLIPMKDTWRRIIVAAASFPEDLSDVDAASRPLSLETSGNCGRLCNGNRISYPVAT